MSDSHPNGILGRDPRPAAIEADLEKDVEKALDLELSTRRCRDSGLSP
jgi:hypothetical protein